MKENKYTNKCLSIFPKVCNYNILNSKPSKKFISCSIIFFFQSKNKSILANLLLPNTPQIALFEQVWK